MQRWGPNRSRRYYEICNAYFSVSCSVMSKLFAIPCTAACQVPLSMGFSRQEYWKGLPFPPPGDLPNPGIKPRSSTLQADSLLSEPLAKSHIKKRQQEHTEELNTQKNKTDFNDLDNHDGVITHLEPDILQCEVNRTLGSITMNKASGGDGILAELLQTLKGCESAALNKPENLESSAVTTGLEKVSFHYNSKERQCQRMLKLPHNCTHLTSQQILKILQARLQQYMKL